MIDTTIRTYSELADIREFEDRFQYLMLRGVVGHPTFGHDRWLNQRFYTSREWRDLRNFVIARDNGCDLAVPGYDIHTKLIIHHMNPMDVKALRHGNDDNMDPEFLITTTLRTHNAIHYGDERQLPKPFVERRRGDTNLW
jgi:hypothetical protein